MWLCTIVALVQSFDWLDAGLIRTPPRLEAEPPPQVWFQIPQMGAPTSFSLSCEASGDPENYQWYKNGRRLTVDNRRVKWTRPKQSGTIEFARPRKTDAGHYQCYVSNIFGTAVSKPVHVQMGLLEHFHRTPLRTVMVTEGDSLTLNCTKPYGYPEPSIFWLYRDEVKTSLMDTINEEHITVDDTGDLHFSYVAQKDGRRNLLYQCAAQSPVIGREHRAGEKVKVVVRSHKRGLTRTKRRLMWSSPEVVTVKAGERLKLMCIFSGYPAPRVTFRRVDGGPLPFDRMDHEAMSMAYDKTLVIEPVRPEDAGAYRCSAVGHHAVIKVAVTAAPYWTSVPPEDISIAEDETVELRCDAGGDPAPIRRWYLNGKPIDGNSTKHTATRSITDGGRVLRIEHLHHDVDTAVYQCNASNPLGYVFANAFINVMAHAPQFTSPEKQHLKVTVGTTVDIDCVVRAAPAPRIELVNSHNQPIKAVPGKLEIFANHTIRIHDVTKGDSALFYCNVTNKWAPPAHRGTPHRYGHNRADTQLDVFEPTWLSEIPTPRAQEIEANQSASFTCLADVDERLHVVYEWRHNGEVIDLSDHMHYQLPKPNKLVVSNARGRHSGLYECVAITEVDVIKEGSSLIVRDVPGTPQIVNIDCQPRRAFVHWRNSSAIHDKVLSYTVEYHTGYHPERWITNMYLDDAAYIRETVEFASEVALSPWVTYTFRVFADNTHGRSEAGEIETQCTTLASVPYTNPANVTVEGDAPSNLVIYWTPMEKEHWNGDMFRYYIRHRLDTPGAPWHEFEIEDPRQDRMVLRDQPTFRKYLVQVGARNELGKSLTEPQIVTGYSGESAPSTAPAHFVVNELVNATAVRFSWTHVNPSSTNGHNLGYVVVVYPPNNGPRHTINPYGQESDDKLEAFVGPGQNTLIVNGLVPMQDYMAHVASRNGRFLGPPSTTQAFVMPQGPPSAVTDMHISAVGANTLLVAWQPPVRRMGILKGYYLTFTDTIKGTRVETFIPNHRHAYMFEEAHANTSYEVSVWAETGGGEGPKSSKPIQTWPMTVPGEPEILVDVLDSNNALVHWHPSETDLPGTAFFVNYTRAGTGVWHRTEEQHLPATSFKLSHLRPEEDYYASVVSVDGDRTRASKHRRFVMHHTASRHVANDYMTSAAWFVAILCAVAVALCSLIVVCMRQNKGGKYAVKRKEEQRGTHHVDQDEDRQFMEYQYGPGYTKDFT